MTQVPEVSTQARASSASGGQAGWQTGLVASSLVVVIASALGQLVLMVRMTDLPDGAATPVLPTDLTGPLVAMVLAAVGGLVVLRGDSLRYGWLMMGMAAISGVVGFAGHYAIYATEFDVPLSSVAIWTQDLWMLGGLLGLLLLPALFPDGSVASPKWRIPVRLTTLAWGVFIVVFVLADRPASNFFFDVDNPPANPTGFLPVPEMALNVIWLVLSVTSIVIAIGSLATRWRRADIELRQRFKWVLYAFGVLLAITALNLANMVVENGAGLELGLSWPLNALSAAATIGLVVALGFAVLRFRLYDIDLVINRTIVYGALTLIIIMTYVGVVAGIGAILPLQESFLALVATGAVAVAFAPLRARVQGWVNRLMFGQRNDPYAVLSEMGRLLARSGTPETTLQTLTETIATSLRLPGAAIELAEEGDWRKWASYGESLDVEAGGTVVPLPHQGEVVGRLVVAPRSPREPLSIQDMELLEDIAHQAGALARSVRLTMALQRSRERLVLAQEEERRRIRHDLHDEVGPTLASQTFQLDAILELLEDDPDGAVELVAALKEQNKQLMADIRRLVYELRPPALDEMGVAGALAAQAVQIGRSSPLNIAISTSPRPLPALSAAVEVAAYRIAREAILNTVRHAGAGECNVTLEATDSDLIISVSDNGIGIDETVLPGIGLTSMRERTAELGGTFTIVATEPTGTKVVATLPLMNGSAEQPEHTTAVARAGTAWMTGEAKP